MKFFTGLAVGGFVGVLLSACITVAGRSDELIDQLEK